MLKFSLIRSLLVAVAVALIVAGSAFAQAPISMNPGSAQVEWQSAVPGSLYLRVSGPGDFNVEQRFAQGEAAVFSVFDASGNLRPAGTYAFEVVVEPALDDAARAELAAIRESGGTVAKSGQLPSERIVSAGSFAIDAGAIVFGGEEEAGPGPVSGTNTISAKDQVILDDLIVDGSACIGQDCVNGESFGFDTLRLKENNLRIKFQDTSNSGSFPSNDWQLTANDSANGGLNRFSIDDIDGGRTPFTIEAGARSNALYVEADGDIGIGTSNPAVDLEVVTGNTPTLRLQQDGSSGFTPQTWDVAGNEANFFVRDVTNGSRLSLRIRPGAPESSIDVASDGDVGVGTSSPGASLHVRRTDGTGSLQVEEVNGTPSQRIMFTLTNNGAPQTELTNSNNNTTWRFGQNNGGDFVINEATDLGTAEMRITAAGEVFVAGSSVHPDYVFHPEYELMPLSELERFVQENRHLPNVQSASDRDQEGGVNITALPIRLLEKVEELTLYTLQQEKQIAELKQQNEERTSQLLQEKDRQLAELTARLEALEQALEQR